MAPATASAPLPPPPPPPPPPRSLPPPPFKPTVLAPAAPRFLSRKSREPLRSPSPAAASSAADPDLAMPSPSCASPAAPASGAPRRVLASVVVGRFNGGMEEDERRDGWEKVGPRRRPRHVAPPQSPRRPCLASTERERAFKKRMQGLCYRCLSSRHFVRHCRDPIRCLSCRRSGHRARDCQDKIAIDPARAAARESARPRPLSTPYVKGGRPFSEVVSGHPGAPPVASDSQGPRGGRREACHRGGKEAMHRERSRSPRRCRTRGTGGGASRHHAAEYAAPLPVKTPALEPLELLPAAAGDKLSSLADLDGSCIRIAVERVMAEAGLSREFLSHVAKLCRDLIALHDTPRDEAAPFLEHVGRCAEPQPLPSSPLAVLDGPASSTAVCEFVGSLSPLLPAAGDAVVVSPSKNEVEVEEEGTDAWQVCAEDHDDELELRTLALLAKEIEVLVLSESAKPHASVLVPQQEILREVPILMAPSPSENDVEVEEEGTDAWQVCAEDHVDELELRTLALLAKEIEDLVLSESAKPHASVLVPQQETLVEVPILMGPEVIADPGPLISSAPTFAESLTVRITAPLLSAAPPLPARRRPRNPVPVPTRQASDRRAVTSMAGLSTIEKGRRVLRKKWGLPAEDETEGVASGEVLQQRFMALFKDPKTALETEAVRALFGRVGPSRSGISKTAGRRATTSAAARAARAAA